MIADIERGKIRNRKAASQLKDFSGLRFDKITPTDIDGFIDFYNKAFVFFEIKYGKTPMPLGQKLGYERLADACESVGIKSMVIVAHHDVDAPEDIDVASLPVSRIRYEKRWSEPSKPYTVRDLCEDFLLSVQEPDAAEACK